MQVNINTECSREAFCSTFDLHKDPSGFKAFVLSIFEWPLKTCLTVYDNAILHICSMFSGKHYSQFSYIYLPRNLSCLNSNVSHHETSNE